MHPLTLDPLNRHAMTEATEHLLKAPSSHGDGRPWWPCASPAGFAVQNAPVLALPSLLNEEASTSTDTTATSFNPHRLSILGFTLHFCFSSLPRTSYRHAKATAVLRAADRYVYIGCGGTAHSVGTVYGGKGHLYTPGVRPASLATPCLASLAMPRRFTGDTLLAPLTTPS